MINKLLIVMILGCVHVTASVANDVKTIITGADNFLKMYVQNGSVDYQSIQKDISGLEQMYFQIGDISLSGVTSSEKKAFYINAYNLIVIYWVSKHYPLKSPLDNSGFFSKVKHKVAGEDLTLDALEHLKLLRIFKDARIHFALACAAKSCPPLASFAFTPENMEQQLTERTTLALNNNNWLMVDNAKKRVELSKIFEWFSKDFTSKGMSVLEWINQYRKEKIPTNYTITYYEYNWALNEQ